jgi:hypothetical protein
MTINWKYCTRPGRLALVGCVWIASVGCGASAACRKGPTDDVAMAARTGGRALETGAKTGVEGVKTGGRAAGGFATDGASGAESGWNRGKAQTSEEAHAGAAETKRETDVPSCD